MHGYICKLPRVNDIAVGIAMMLFGTGVAFFFGKPYIQPSAPRLGSFSLGAWTGNQEIATALQINPLLIVGVLVGVVAEGQAVVEPHLQEFGAGVALSPDLQFAFVDEADGPDVMRFQDCGNSAIDLLQGFEVAEGEIVAGQRSGQIVDGEHQRFLVAGLRLRRKVWSRESLRRGAGKYGVGQRERQRRGNQRDAELSHQWPQYGRWKSVVRQRCVLWRICTKVQKGICGAHSRINANQNQITGCSLNTIWRVRLKIKTKQLFCGHNRKR